MSLLHNIPRAPRVLVALGILCIVIFRMVEPHVDKDGVLHEPFGLLPIGLVLILLGGLWTAVSFSIRYIKRRRFRG